MQRMKEAESKKKSKLLEKQHHHLYYDDAKQDHLEPPSGSSKKLSSSSKGSSSFDSIDFPLKIVKQCMERLEIKQREDEEKAREEAAGNQVDNPSVMKLTTTDSHPLDASNSPTPPSSRLARENLRLNDLKIVYPQGSSQVKEATKEVLVLDQLKKDMMSVALEWESLRLSKECSCGFAFEQKSPRSHCYSCGRLHCLRCIDRKILLPGHVVFQKGDILSSGSSDVFESPTLSAGSSTFDSETVSVCRSCYKLILDKDSFTSPS